MAARLLRWLAHAVTHLFYAVDRAGSPPATGAVLLLPNHANALLDPPIVWTSAGRDVRFLAKSTLFHGPFAPVLKAAGAIPVYRRIDEGADPSRNAETFDAVDRALAAGEVICLFPEGVSHSTGRLEPLRTGAARMALAAERRGVAVRLVAVGLNFDRKTVFRSRVTVVFGRPFGARDLVDADGSAAVKLLTSRIANEMRRLLVEIDPGLDEHMVARVERLYASARGEAQDPEARLTRRRTIAAAIRKLRTTDPERLLDLGARLDRYDRRMRRFGLSDSHLDWDVSTRAALAFTIREGLAAILLAPLALAGLALFWIPYSITDGLARRVATGQDVTATAKVLIGGTVYALWITLIVAAAAWWLGMRAALLIAATLPLAAIAARYAIERETAVLDTISAWLALRRARNPTRSRLRSTRSDLAELLDRVSESLSAETNGRAAAKTRH